MKYFLKQYNKRPFRKHYTTQDTSTLSNRQRKLHYIHEVPFVNLNKPLNKTRMSAAFFIFFNRIALNQSTEVVSSIDRVRNSRKMFWWRESNVNVAPYFHCQDFFFFFFKVKRSLLSDSWEHKRYGSPRRSTPDFKDVLFVWKTRFRGARSDYYFDLRSDFRNTI